MLGSWVAPASSNVGMHRLHLYTLLPILCGSADAATYLCEEDVELRDLLSFVRGQKVLGVATIELSGAALAATSDPQPNLCVLLKTESGSTFLYSGLWLDYANGHCLVHFLIDPARLVGATINLVGAHLLSQNLGCYHDVEATPCPEPPADLAAWLASLSGNSVPFGQSITRLEEKECWKLSIDLSGEWWACVEAGDTVDTNAREGSTCLEVHMKLRPKLRMPIVLPSPLSKKGIRLLLSRKRRNLTVIVPKAAYGFATRSPAELFLDNFDTWPMCRPDDEFMMTVSGLQMSDEEKFVSRTRAPSDIPALIGLKDTAMFFFQVQDERVMQIIVSENGTAGNKIYALVIHHGVRREVRSGTPAADLSIYFLRTAPTTTYWSSPGGKRRMEMKSCAIYYAAICTSTSFSSSLCSYSLHVRKTRGRGVRHRNVKPFQRSCAGGSCACFSLRSLHTKRSSTVQWRSKAALSLMTTASNSPWLRRLNPSRIRVAVW